MSKKWFAGRMLGGLLALGLVSAGAALLIEPGVAEAGPGKKGGPELEWAKRWIHAHMQLGEHALREGNYKEALEHFEAVIAFEGNLPEGKLPALPEGKEEEALQGKGRGKRRGQGGPELEDGEEGQEGFGPGNHRGGPRKKLAMVKIRARMGAAIALHRQGKTGESESMAEDALRIAKAENMERAVKRCERFLEEPEEVIERAAPTKAELKAQLKKLEEVKP